MNNEILYGKGIQEKVVSIEIQDGSAELFIQDENGNVTSQFVPNKFWLLTNNPLQNFTKLKGDLFYNYGRQFKTREEFLKTRNYLKNHETFCVFDPKESFQILKGETLYKGLKPQEVTILSFDIETTGAKLNDSSKLLLISNTLRKNGSIIKKLFSYDDFNDEGEMIEAWCKWVCEVDPSIITGYYINFFDFDYIKFIADKFNVQLKLGRNGSNLSVSHYESKFRKDGSQFYHYHKKHIYGREIIDGYFLALKYDIARKYENYKLKYIINFEGLEKKGRTFYDAAKIKDNYKDPFEWDLIKEYAKDDSDDALAIFDLMASSQFYWTQIVPMSFQAVTERATGSQINSIMNRSYLQNGHSLPKADEIKEKFEGAISYGNPGIYSNCLKWDVSSLYPSIILQYAICNKEKDPEQNFLKLVKTLTEERLKNKKLAKETGERYYKDMSESQKIGINSAYGFLGASGLNFNYLRGASEITSYGREILKGAIKWATGKEFEVLNENPVTN